MQIEIAKNYNEVSSNLKQMLICLFVPILAIKIDTKMICFRYLAFVTFLYCVHHRGD